MKPAPEIPLVAWRSRPLLRPGRGWPFAHQLDQRGGSAPRYLRTLENLTPISVSEFPRSLSDGGSKPRSGLMPRPVHVARWAGARGRRRGVRDRPGVRQPPCRRGRRWRGARRHRAARPGRRGGAGVARGAQERRRRAHHPAHPPAPRPCRRRSRSASPLGRPGRGARGGRTGHHGRAAGRPPAASTGCSRCSSGRRSPCRWTRR
jgi:hypothetical protein